MSIMDDIQKTMDEFNEAVDKVFEKYKKVEPKVTGRSFMTGIKEPMQAEVVWFWIDDEFNGKNILYAAYDGNYEVHQNMLKRGAFYPTEADCELGEKRKEVQARYRAMADGFDASKLNYHAYKPQNGTSEPILAVNPIAGAAYFRDYNSCQSAIDTINRLYGEHAFERYVLEVEP